MPESPNIKLRQPPDPPAVRHTAPVPPYAELDVTSNFSFLHGASHPDELVFRATELGYHSIAITDRNSLAGVVRAHDAVRQVKEQGGVAPRLIIGARLVFADAPDLLVWPTNRAAYGRLCRLLTLGRRRAPKGKCLLYLEDFLEQQEGMLAAIVGGRHEEEDSGQSEGERMKDEPDQRYIPSTPGSERSDDPGTAQDSGLRTQDSSPTHYQRPTPNSPSQDSGLSTQDLSPTTHYQPPTINSSSLRLAHSPYALLRDAMGDRLSLAVSALYGPDDRTRLAHLAQISRTFGIPLLAANHVHYHDPSRRELQDVLVCIREHCTIAEAGFRLFANGERYLKSPDQMHRLFAGHPQALRRGIEVAEQCTFSLDELKYEYPHEVIPPDMRPIEYLRQLADDGAARRYPAGVPEKVRTLLDHELALIEQLHFEPYFLTVYDLVKFARSRGILCQGRGSAANSAVCYCLGVTSVDPAHIDLLFERFISAARNEPPDIDVDFEHERREEVLQYLYQKYGRERAGMTGVVITYRGRSAVRDVGKALGLSLDMVDQMAKKFDWWHRGTLQDDMLRQLGLDPADRTVRLVIDLTAQILGFPRHLSQHVGGMVMTQGPLCELVPIENAAMEGRTVIEWDKDDIDALGILKVDVLALGMLTCISKALVMVNSSRRHEGTKARRHEGNSETGHGEQHVGDSNISRFDCLAEGNGPGAHDLSCDDANAIVGAVRVDQPDAAGSGIDSIEHRGRLRETNALGIPALSANRARFVGRAIDTVRTGDRPDDDRAKPTDHRSLERGRPHPPGPDSQFGSEVGITSSIPPSCLRASVPSCLELHTIPPEDPAVYDMISNADTVGVFQIESRAQMSMLPRLRPRCFYDLVIEVAIVRPGPIQGDMVHPYLRRRNGEEPVTYPSQALRNVLQKTLGVPLFQEQAMRVAMVGAGFTAGEADQLRRAMAAWRKNGAIDRFREKIISGMLANGYTQAFAEQCFNQIKGFGEYGFPESHAASFALLVYVSAWLKRHHPAAFAASLLNSQPMGFYAPAQIIRDAREHHVPILPIDVNHSQWDCTLEERHGGEEKTKDEGRRQKDESDGASSTPGSERSDDPGTTQDSGLSTQHLSSTINYQLPTTHSYSLSLRLGLRLVKGLRQEHAHHIAEARDHFKRFATIAQFRRATGLPVSTIRLLAEADAFGSLGFTRRQALWQAMELKDEPAPLFDSLDLDNAEPPTSHAIVSDAMAAAAVEEDAGEDAELSALPPMPLGQEVMIDYQTTTFSLKSHPVALVRDQLQQLGLVRAADIAQAPQGGWVKVAGLVLIRQRPGTASGIVFETLEDETGIVNLIVKPDVYERYRAAARQAGLLRCDGRVQRQGQVIHIMAVRLYDLSDFLTGCEFRSRDFH